MAGVTSTRCGRWLLPRRQRMIVLPLARPERDGGNEKRSGAGRSSGSGPGTRCRVGGVIGVSAGPTTRALGAVKRGNRTSNDASGRAGAATLALMLASPGHRGLRWRRAGRARAGRGMRTGTRLVEFRRKGLMVQRRRAVGDADADNTVNCGRTSARSRIPAGRARAPMESAGRCRGMRDTPRCVQRLRPAHHARLRRRVRGGVQRGGAFKYINGASLPCDRGGRRLRLTAHPACAASPSPTL